MNIGWVGLGKMGAPCALALAEHHTVTGHDQNREIVKYFNTGNFPYREKGLRSAWERVTRAGSFTWSDDIAGVVAASNVVFVAVQTPHAPQFEGVTPLSDDRADFDYSYLAAAVRQVCHQADTQKRPITVVVVSTVLPGTTDRLLRRYENDYAHLVYSPSFIAMGTAYDDFTNPEMVLVGSDQEESDLFMAIYEPVHFAPIVSVSIPSAEMAKVTYNAFIGAKIVLANTIMEMCELGPGDADEVSFALSHATRRLWSPAYTKGGMGDGGGCHPRDAIALSHLARRLGLSFDFFGTLMEAREAQSQWLAEKVKYHSDVSGLPVVVLGRAYKEGTDLTVGSPSKLLTYQLDEMGADVESVLDPYVGSALPPDRPSVFVIATRHPEFATFEYPIGSIVIDPWGYIEDRAGVTVVRVGRG